MQKPNFLLHCHHECSNVLGSDIIDDNFSSVAEIHLEKGQFSAAETLYRSLIERNPDNLTYYEQLEKCLKIGE